MTFRTILSVIFVAAVAGDARADNGPIVIKLSHVVAEDAPKGRAAALFKRRAEELTSGRVRVEVHANGSLYRDRDEIEALLLGAVQMLAPSLSKLAPLGAREFEVFDLPFVFADEAALRKVTDGPVGRRLLTRLEPTGILGLAYWDGGFKSFSANTPLRAPEDFRGLRMRIQPSAVLGAQMRALGALPHVSGFSEARDALAAGVVDGTENPIANFYTQRMHEVQRHLSLTRHGYLGYAVIVNARFWRALPSRVRGQLERALAEATVYANRMAREVEEEDLRKIVAAGTTRVHTPTPAERLALKKALLRVHAEMEGRVGRSLLRDVYVATEFTPDAP